MTLLKVDIAALWVDRGVSQSLCVLRVTAKQSMPAEWINLSRPDMIDIASAIDSKCNELLPETPFASLGIVFDAAEAETLTLLKVGGTKAYDNFGAFDRLQPELARFLMEYGNDTAHAEAAAGLIAGFVAASLHGLKAEATWVTLRASNPMTDFDIPRWHCDGYYYVPYEGEAHKIVLTLKGAGTLFNNLSPDERAAWEDTYVKTQGNPEQQKIVAQVVPIANVSQAGLHEPYLYITGAPYAAIHSEPPIHEDRLFMSIVPGTTAQIDELREAWHEKATTYG